tara:strand:+ start:755 stop:1108 length:354 start_codon:yes stop_codon:yes gene_type:complete
MTEWTQNGKIVTSDRTNAFEFLEKIGADLVNHYDLIQFGDVSEVFLQSISKIRHVYTSSDKLSKLAHRYYGDPRLWWVIAWFNQKPTDFHCKIGDIIEVPVYDHLDLILFEARNTVF